MLKGERQSISYRTGSVEKMKREGFKLISFLCIGCEKGMVEVYRR
jgi:hypothetical protein